KVAALRNFRVPAGAEDVYNTLIRGGEGDAVDAMLAHAARQKMMVGAGAAEAIGNRTLSQFFKDNVKGVSKGRVRDALHQAQVSGEPNFLNKMYADVLKSYEDITGHSIDPDFLRDPNRYVPHILTPSARRSLKKAIAGGDENAKTFARLTGFTSDDLMESSGFL